MARQRIPDDNDPYIDNPSGSYVREQQRMAEAYGEGYSENIQGEARDLREQLQNAVREAASEHIGEPINNETRTQLSNTVATAIIDSMNTTSATVDRVMGGPLNNGTTTLTNRTLESGQPMMNSINMEMTITNTANVVKDSHGNPLFCYGCAGSAADVSFPSYAVEWRCSDCIRCTNEEMTSLEKEGQQTYDKYINAEYAQELERRIKEAYKKELKKEVIEELNTDKTILTGQKLKRLIKNG